MAKGRVGVLEAHENTDLAIPRSFCGRAIAHDLVCAREAVRLGKRRIQMVKMKASTAIQRAQHAHALRELAESAVLRMKPYWTDGRTTAGNVLAFSRLRNDGEKLHYWIGPPQHSRRFHCLPCFSVSGKSRIARAIIASKFAPIIPTVLPASIAASA